jgi:hypothetical protein
MRIRTNQADFYVSAEMAREHLVWLSGQDVGMRAVGDVTGIAYQVVQKIRQGGERRIRRST